MRIVTRLLVWLSGSRAAAERPAPDAPRPPRPPGRPGPDRPIDVPPGRPGRTSPDPTPIDDPRPSKPRKLEAYAASARSAGLLGSRFALLAASVLVAGVTWSQSPTDSDITAAVERKLAVAAANEEQPVRVVTEDGIVSLVGSLPTLRAKDRAQRVAEAIRGVRGIVNRLTVATPARKSSEMEEDIQSALALDVVTEHRDIFANAAGDGSVVLTGRVDSWTERTAAEYVTKGVVGVTAVRNDIVVAHAVTQRSDPDIRSDISRRLRWDALLDEHDIAVMVEDGHVVLSGSVVSRADVIRAAVDAQVPGAISVDAGALNVAPVDEARPLRAAKYFPRSDEEIREAMADALSFDPRLLSFNIDAEVVSGMAILRGVVGDLEAKRSAEADALNIAGVTGVRNELDVRPEHDVNEARIAERVRRALALSGELASGAQIGVEVEGSRVNLFGTVDTLGQHIEAETVASRVPGISGIENHLAVISKPAYPFAPHSGYPYNLTPIDYEALRAPGAIAGKDDATLVRDVESEIYWSAFVDAYQVNVSAMEGVVTLRGEVDTPQERAAAVANAFDAGAVDVRDLLTIASTGATR